MADYVIIGGELYHHGIKGQKWGIRRYQNSDGSLTDAGKKRAKKKFSQKSNSRLIFELNRYNDANTVYDIMRKRNNSYATESITNYGRNFFEKESRTYSKQIAKGKDMSEILMKELQERGANIKKVTSYGRSFVDRHANELWVWDGEAYIEEK